MKKLYTLIALAFLTFQAKNSFSQTSFLYKITDTIVYSDTMTLGDIEIDGNWVINKTAAKCTLDVIRDVNVNTPWTSAFCLQVCYADFIDSVRVELAPNDTVPFIPHFYIDAAPDSEKICMRIKNVLVPTDVAYQCFYGVTKIGYSGIHEYANLANVSVYPSPVKAGNPFYMSITNAKVPATEFMLVVSDMYGRTVSQTSVRTGSNSLNLNLATGLYGYKLVAGGKQVRAGKIIVIQ